ncbi:type I restriction-modification system subunit M N-terminal domain-containing protein [uncultured Thiodictyon sp.]|uniref:type I restriction-modification system subunit M N-terminal domain-containing protein n=1 Tax=uncultured Thiodictyon sp. TaxID=1846217 RepID=UPI0025D7A71D|nr:type I restriction-modification system subunit M N-terminal domain-containing protein [uncultured Thiodictyon sp.]
MAAEIWKSAVRLRGKFKAYEYQGVILPIIVIRRLECALIRWREDKRSEVLAQRPGIDKDEPLGPEHLSNLEMGYVYEELLRRFSEEAGEEAGDQLPESRHRFDYMLSNPPFGVTSLNFRNSHTIRTPAPRCSVMTKCAATTI